MTQAAKKLKTELAKLSTKDRAELAHFLIGSLDDSVDKDAEAKWEAELARRADQIKGGTTAGIPVEKVFADLRARHG